VWEYFEDGAWSKGQLWQSSRYVRTKDQRRAVAPSIRKWEGGVPCTKCPVYFVFTRTDDSPRHYQILEDAVPLCWCNCKVCGRRETSLHEVPRLSCYDASSKCVIMYDISGVSNSYTKGEVLQTLQDVWRGERRGITRMWRKMDIVKWKIQWRMQYKWRSLQCILPTTWRIYSFLFL
jgi:hypothetical protein